jgi:hypothetical protein
MGDRKTELLRNWLQDHPVTTENQAEIDISLTE